MVLSLRETGSRYSALGIAYNLASMLMGGTAPLIATYLAGSAVGILGNGFYLAAASLVAVITLISSEATNPILGGDSKLLRAQVEPAQIDLTPIGPTVESRYTENAPAPQQPPQHAPPSTQPCEPSLTPHAIDLASARTVTGPLRALPSMHGCGLRLQRVLGHLGRRHVVFF